MEGHRYFEQNDTKIKDLNSVCNKLKKNNDRLENLVGNLAFAVRTLENSRVSNSFSGGTMNISNVAIIKQPRQYPYMQP